MISHRTMVSVGFAIAFIILGMYLRDMTTSKNQSLSAATINQQQPPVQPAVVKPAQKPSTGKPAPVKTKRKHVGHRHRGHHHRQVAFAPMPQMPYIDMSRAYEDAPPGSTKGQWFAVGRTLLGGGFNAIAARVGRPSGGGPSLASVGVSVSNPGWSSGSSGPVGGGGVSSNGNTAPATIAPGSSGPATWLSSSQPNVGTSGPVGGSSQPAAGTSGPVGGGGIN